MTTATDAKFDSAEFAMSGAHFPIEWNSLVEDLNTARFGRIPKFQAEEDSDSRSQALHSNTSRFKVTAIERKVIHGLDRRCCFITNGSGDTEVAHILDNCNAENKKLVDALRGLGVVHRDFNLADISNLLLMSQRQHFLWDRKAAFIIVPSKDTREHMTSIIAEDRRRVIRAVESKQTVEPCQLAYPKSMAYDIILIQPSLFGGAPWYFLRSENQNEYPTRYRTPTPDVHLNTRQEYLIKDDDGTPVREFLNVQHLTDRSEEQAINPYLMVMNALPKFKYWRGKGIGLPAGEPDEVFTTAYRQCESIMGLISLLTGGVIQMSKAHSHGRAQGSEEYSAPANNNGDKTAPPKLIKDLPGDLELPPDCDHLCYDPSTKAESQSWISRGDFDKTRSMENWRQEVSELSDVV